VTRNPFLSRELLTNQFARDPQGGPRMMSQRLSTAEFGVRWTDGPSYRKNGTITFKHYERCTLIRKPAERFKGDEPVAPNHY